MTVEKEPINTIYLHTTILENSATLLISPWPSVQILSFHYSAGAGAGEKSVQDEEALQSVLGSESLHGNTTLPP
jgi:hypothetical protein